MKHKLRKKGRRVVREIMERENPQRKVDEIVRKTQLAIEICKQANQQNKVDKWVEEAKKNM